MNLKNLINLKIMATLTFLVASAFMVNAQTEQTDRNKVAFVTSPEVFNKVVNNETLGNDDQEAAALKYFVTGYLKKSSVEEAADNIILIGEPGSTDDFDKAQLQKINPGNYKCLWIHLDGNFEKGWRKLPARFRSPEFISRLYEYYLSGGNIYLSSQASQLVSAIYRIHKDMVPNVFDNAGGENGDNWAIRSNIRQGHDNSNHPLFNGMESFTKTDTDGAETIAYNILGGSYYRLNHNTMWHLLPMRYGTFNSYTYDDEDPKQKVSNFELANHARVLATFDWDCNQTASEFAGIVEFFPMYTWDHSTYELTRKSGTVITNGMSAFQWYTEAENTCAANLKKFTDNTLDYLSVERYIPGDVSQKFPIYMPVGNGQEEILESSGLVALVLGINRADLNDSQKLSDWRARYPHEAVAYDYFVSVFLSKYGDKAGIICLDELDNIKFKDQKSTESYTGYECIWVNIDRDGFERETWDLSEKGTPIGYEDLKKIFPGEGYTFNYDKLISRLKDFKADGGNIYFSKWANILASQVSAVDAPNHVTAKKKDNPEQTGEPWKICINQNGFDHSDHPIFQNLNHDGHTLVLFSNNTNRVDRNCGWRIGGYTDENMGGNLPGLPGYEGTREGKVQAFCRKNNAKVLGTWGHDDSEAALGTAFLVEFMPGAGAQSSDAPQRIVSKSVVDARRGTMIANGPGAYQFETIDGNNDSNGNVTGLTSNILAYLSPVYVLDMLTGVDEITDMPTSDAMPVYYNLQGVRVNCPVEGIYIEVRGNKARKVILK